MVCTQIEFWLNCWRFKYTHIAIVIVFGLFYSFINMLVTLSKGTPVYHILTWKDWGTLFFVVGLCIFTAAVYMIYAKISVVRDKRNNSIVYMGKKKQDV